MNEAPTVVIAGSRGSSFPADEFGERIHLVPARTDEELRREVRSADVLYSWKIPREIPSETPRLRWVQLPSAGVDHIRGLPIWESEIVITASQGIHSVPMAEHVMALTLALSRQIPAMVRAQMQREWRREGSSSLQLRELRGKTMGIIGWGKVGDSVAHLARAFGMRVIGTRWSIMVPREVLGVADSAYVDPPWVEGIETRPDIVFPAAKLHQVLAQSDVVVLVLPLTDETRGSFAEPEFRAMKPGATLINIGRGAVVCESALLDALRSGRLGSAGLDVFEEEPLPRADPLWTMDNVIISPHVGGVSDRTAERAIHLFAVNLARFLEDQPLLNVVDRERGY